MATDPAVDVWALGVMAYELLTRKHVFQPHQLTKENAWETICQKLPWELAGNPEHRADMKSLGFMRQGILGMLKRNPAERVTLEHLRATWRSVLNPPTLTESLNS